jgi:hypothetical protein
VSGVSRWRGLLRGFFSSENEMRFSFLSPRRSGFSFSLLLSPRRSVSGRLRRCFSLAPLPAAWRFCLRSYGVGLSLNCFSSISVAPVRGRHLLFFAAAKKSRQKKAAQTANAKWEPWPASGSGSVESVLLHPHALVTKVSSAPTPHCVRRGRVCTGNQSFG